MNIPDGMRLLVHGRADFMREVADEMKAADIRVATGPIPGGG